MPAGRWWSPCCFRQWYQHPHVIYVSDVMFGQQWGEWGKNSSQTSRILVAEGQPLSSERLKQVSRIEGRHPFLGAAQKNRQDPYPRELRFSWVDRLDYVLEELNK